MKLKLTATHINNSVEDFVIEPISVTGTGNFEQAYNRAYTKLIKEILEEHGDFSGVRYSQFNEKVDKQTGETEWEFVSEYSKS